jgi:hypothetical protein
MLSVEGGCIIVTFVFFKIFTLTLAGKMVITWENKVE